MILGQNCPFDVLYIIFKNWLQISESKFEQRFTVMLDFAKCHGISEYTLIKSMRKKLEPSRLNIQLDYCEDEIDQEIYTNRHVSGLERTSFTVYKEILFKDLYKQHGYCDMHELKCISISVVEYHLDDDFQSLQFTEHYIKLIRMIYYSCNSLCNAHRNCQHTKFTMEVVFKYNNDICQYDLVLVYGDNDDETFNSEAGSFSAEKMIALSLHFNILPNMDLCAIE